MTTTGVALFYSYRQVPMYTSTAEVVIFPATFEKQPSAAYLPINMLTEERVANSAFVAELANKHLTDLGMSPASATASVIKDASGGVTQDIQFTSTTPRPATAHATAQAYADAYLEYRKTGVLKDLEAARRPLDDALAQVERELRRTTRALGTAKSNNERLLLNNQYVTLLSQRSQVIQQRNELPSPGEIHVGDLVRPASPSARVGAGAIGTATLGLFVGLALGIAFAFFRDRLDERVRGRDELELHSGAPVLAFIPRASSNGLPITLSEPMSAGAAAYQALRVRLLHVAGQRALKSLVITSAVAGEGKTSTTANLGVVLAQARKQVVMLSADLRRPGLEAFFSKGRETGLSDVLLGRRKLLESLSATGVQNLWILPAGPLGPGPGTLELLGSEAMSSLLAQLREVADFVLIDTPPLLGTPDAAALAPLADGVLFVADPRRVERPTLEQARRDLHLVGAPVIGVVVNKYEPHRFRAYGSPYDYSWPGPEKRSGPPPGMLPDPRVGSGTGSFESGEPPG